MEDKLKELIEYKRLKLVDEKEVKIKANKLEKRATLLIDSAKPIREESY